MKSENLSGKLPQPLLRVIQRALEFAAPPPDVDVSEWANEFRYLSPESSAEPGPWRNDNAPHTVEPMRCLSPSSPYRQVVCKWSSQSAKTEIANNFVGFCMDIDPGPILVVQPNVKPMGEAWSKDRLAPMIRDTPALRKVGEINTSQSGSKDTILHKVFPGGHITVAGANSPAGLASRPIRYLLADEIDRYEPTKEGDSLALARKRLLTYRNRDMSKELVVSSPTFSDMGVDSEYKACDRQLEWHFTCMECQYTFRPVFKYFTFSTTTESPTDPKDIEMECPHCGSSYVEDDEYAVKMHGGYEVVKDEGTRSVGFWFNQWASPFASWYDTIQEFLKAKNDPEELQVVINTAFCETWEELGEKVDPDSIRANAEIFDPEAPEGVLYITFGTDVQGDRLEMEVTGWGENEESWSLDYHIIEGTTDNHRKGAWLEHTELLKQTYTTVGGVRLPISAGIVDSGWQASVVYKYVISLRKSKIWAGKGSPGHGTPFVEEKSTRAKRLRKRTRAKYRPQMIGVDEGKTIIYNRLALKPFEHEDGRKIFPPGYSHFPVEYDEEHYKQLTAEKVIKRKSRGHVVRVWVQVYDRNEVLDCRNYSFAALRLVRPDFEKIKNALFKKKPEPKAKTPLPSVQQVIKRNRKGSGPQKKSSFVRGW